MSQIEKGYNITTDHNFINEQFCITPELSRKLEKYHHLALGGEKSSIQKLLNAIEKYPDSPHLKNFLSVLYGQLHETEKMYGVNKWIVAEHPDYLFGKLNLANEYYLKHQYDKMASVLGPEMEIGALYPDRETFHLVEVIAFLKCAVLYFAAIGDIEQAEMRWNIMHELAPDSEDTELASELLYDATIIIAQEQYEEELKKKTLVETKVQETTSITQAPNFNHPEIDWLYSNGLTIGSEKLNTILSLPKDSLIQDLELVLQDSINRYSFFNNWVDENGFIEEKMKFVVHAIFILGELKASKSINTIFNVLSQSEEYLELYLDDYITAIWEPLYKIAGNNLEVCKQFLFRPGIATYARLTVPEFIEQIVLHHPERRDEVLNWFNSVIEFFLDSSLEDNVIDSDLIALLIFNIVDFNGSELLPRIEQLFEKEIVSTDICGDWEDVKEAFEYYDEHNKKRRILTVEERYKEFNIVWDGLSLEEINSGVNVDDFTESSYRPINALPKTGRNDPCPCGSGKKYKKCCLNN